MVLEELGLTESLGDRIRDWNCRYRVVIPLDQIERVSSPPAALIDALDQEALIPVRAIETEVPWRCRFRCSSFNTRWFGWCRHSRPLQSVQAT